MSERLKKLEEKKRYYQNKLFMVAFEIIFIFGIPALGAFLGGRRLDEMQGTGKKITLGLLFGAFVISWIILIFRVKSLRKQMLDAEDEWKEAKEQEPKPQIGVPQKISKE